MEYRGWKAWRHWSGLWLGYGECEGQWVTSYTIDGLRKLIDELED